MAPIRGCRQYKAQNQIDTYWTLSRNFNLHAGFLNIKNQTSRHTLGASQLGELHLLVHVSPLVLDDSVCISGLCQILYRTSARKIEYVIKDLENSQHPRIGSPRVSNPVMSQCQWHVRAVSTSLSWFQLPGVFWVLMFTPVCTTTFH